MVAVGDPVMDVSGELVCTKPFPSMPSHFWNDPDGAKYKRAYFSKYPGKDGKDILHRVRSNPIEILCVVHLNDIQVLDKCNIEQNSGRVELWLILSYQSFDEENFC